MLDRGLAHVLASDAHDAVDRPPDLAVALPALRERYAAPEALFEWMTAARPGGRAGRRRRTAAPGAG